MNRLLLLALVAQTAARADRAVTEDQAWEIAHREVDGLDLDALDEAGLRFILQHADWAGAMLGAYAELLIEPTR